MRLSECFGMRWNVERISEASRHIPKNLRARHPEIPWQKVAGIGNVLRHAYPIVEDSVVWDVVAQDLPPLQAAIERMLRDAESKGTT